MRHHSDDVFLLFAVEAFAAITITQSRFYLGCYAERRRRNDSDTSECDRTLDGNLFEQQDKKISPKVEWITQIIKHSPSITSHKSVSSCKANSSTSFTPFARVSSDESWQNMVKSRWISARNSASFNSPCVHRSGMKFYATSSSAIKLCNKSGKKYFWVERKF